MGNFGQKYQKLRKLGGKHPENLSYFDNMLMDSGQIDGQKIRVSEEDLPDDFPKEGRVATTQITILANPIWWNPMWIVPRLMVIQLYLARD